MIKKILTGISLLSIFAITLAFAPAVIAAEERNPQAIDQMGGSDLGRLLLLSRIFDGGERDLGDLFLLERLFSGEGGGIFNGNGGTGLGDLFLLDRLFNR